MRSSCFRGVVVTPLSPIGIACSRLGCYVQGRYSSSYIIYVGTNYRSAQDVSTPGVHAWDDGKGNPCIDRIRSVTRRWRTPGSSTSHPPTPVLQTLDINPGYRPRILATVIVEVVATDTWSCVRVQRIVIYNWSCINGFSNIESLYNDGGDHEGYNELQLLLAYLWNMG